MIARRRQGAGPAGARPPDPAHARRAVQRRHDRAGRSARSCPSWRRRPSAARSRCRLEHARPARRRGATRARRARPAPPGRRLGGAAGAVRPAAAPVRRAAARPVSRSPRWAGRSPSSARVVVARRRASGWEELLILAGACIVALLLGLLSTVGRLGLDIDVDVEPPRVVVGGDAVGWVRVTNERSRPSLGLPRRGARRRRRGRASTSAPSPPASRYEEPFVVPTQRRSIIPIGPARSVQGRRPRHRPPRGGLRADGSTSTSTPGPTVARRRSPPDGSATSRAAPPTTCPPATSPSTRCASTYPATTAATSTGARRPGSGR